MKLSCKPVFERLGEIAAEFAPEKSEKITWVPADQVWQTALMLAHNRPLSMYMWNGVGQHTNATQTSRAIASLYALLGDFDRQGGNVTFPKAADQQCRRQRVSIERSGGAAHRPREKAARPAGKAGQLRRLRYFHRDPRRTALSDQSVSHLRLNHGDVQSPTRAAPAKR